MAHLHSPDTHVHHHHSGPEESETEHDYSHMHERETIMVIYLASVTMVLEIFFGYYTNSMALLPDGLTSLTVVIALLAGLFYQIYSLDAISGIISFFVITKWAIDLINSSGSELIEFTSKHSYKMIMPDTPGNTFTSVYALKI